MSTAGQFSDSFKREVAQKAIRGDKSVPELAKELGISSSSIYRWRRDHAAAEAKQTEKAKMKEGVLEDKIGSSGKKEKKPSGKKLEKRERKGSTSKKSMGGKTGTAGKKGSSGKKGGAGFGSSSKSGKKGSGKGKKGKKGSKVSGKKSSKGKKGKKK